MVKRPADDNLNGNQAYLKRQKITKSVSALGPAEEIGSARQLRQLLAFDQDAARSRQGIHSFKSFLDSFVTSEDENTRRISILREYLESQRTSDEIDKDTIFLSDLMQIWSFAAQTNDESLLSAVPAVLALLLKTVSNILEFSEHGLRLGRTLLQKKQTELIARGLTSPKGKDFMISPVLRLLREICIFDGGVLAKQVFNGRENTLKGLARNLSLRYKGDGFEDPKKPSVRTNAVQVLLPLFKFLPADAKRELLNQRDIISALTREIHDDPPFIVRSILETLKAHVLLDQTLLRDAKTKIVNSTSLGRIAFLYRYEQLAEVDEKSTKKPVGEVAHEFLTLACTSLELGVLVRQGGFYPRGVNADDIHDPAIEGSFIDLDLDSIEWMEKFTEKVPVRNTILSDFIQHLRPWSSAKQSELLQSIFKSAPELVADYFYGKKDFSFDPKLTATWMGYSAFIFSSLQLPIPKYFGHPDRYARLPPPPAIVLESILPQPLTQRVLTRCLTQPNNSLITFFAVRILCIAFSKMQEVLKMYSEASSPLWTEAADRLTESFCERCPAIKDVILSFRRLTSDDLLQREAVTKLLVLYYEVVPRIALDAKFGVSAALAETLQAIEEPTLTAENRVLRSVELEHLFQFAHFSPGMRWFGKADGLSASPFMTMLKLSVAASVELPLLKLRSVLLSVIEENQILQTQTAIIALDTFILTLRALQPVSSAVYNFLDECISRCASKPIKYVLSLEEICKAGTSKAKPLVSLLSLAIAEQWPFLVKSADSHSLDEVAQFVARHFAASIKIGEDKNAIKILIQNMAADSPENSTVRKTIERSRKLVDSVVVAEPLIDSPTSDRNTLDVSTPDADEAEILAKLADTAGDVAEDHSSLIKWTTKEIDEVIEGGYAAALIMLLSSKHLGIRKEAATNLSKIAAKLKESSFEEKDQIWLLLCEVVDTAKLTISDDPLPTYISAFASQAIPVLGDPLHFLYAKINKFLLKGPVWQADKLPLMHKILDEQPTLDDAHFQEVGWLLSYLLAGLRTEADMSQYRKRLVFEKLLSIYNSKYLAAGLRDKILRIFFRATTIEGGSTTLVTRFSTMTWLEAQTALGGGTPLKVLIEEIWKSCDQKRVVKWNKGAKRNMSKPKK